MTLDTRPATASVEEVTEGDLLGRGMARVVGQQIREFQDRIKRLEFQLDVAADPHAVSCKTGIWNGCTCGLRELMEPDVGV